jgi:hypothetical protein
VRAYDVVIMLQDGHPTALGEAIAMCGGSPSDCTSWPTSNTDETYRRDIEGIRNLQEGRRPGQEDLMGGSDPDAVGGRPAAMTSCCHSCCRSALPHEACGRRKSASSLPAAQIAELLECHPATVRRWISRSTAKGWRGWPAGPGRGRPG